MGNSYYDDQRNIRRPNALQRKYKSGKGGPISQQLYDIIMIMSGRYKELSKEQNYALKKRTIRRIRAYTLALISFYCGMSAKSCMQEKDLENDYVVVSQVAQFYEKIPTGKDGVDEFVLTNGTRVEYKKTKRDDNNQKWVKCKTEDGETCYVRAENVKSIESFSDVYEVDTDTYSIDVKVMPTSLSGTVRTIADGAVVKLDPDTLKDGYCQIYFEDGSCIGYVQFEQLKSISEENEKIEIEKPQQYEDFEFESQTVKEQAFLDGPSYSVFNASTDKAYLLDISAYDHPDDFREFIEYLKSTNSNVQGIIMEIGKTHPGKDGFRIQTISDSTPQSGNESLDQKYSKIQASSTTGIQFNIDDNGNTERSMGDYDNLVQYIQIAREAGLHVGFYFLSSSVNTPEALVEAAYLDAVLTELKKDGYYESVIPLMIDVEDQGSNDRQMVAKREGREEDVSIAKAQLINSLGSYGWVTEEKGVLLYTLPKNLQVPGEQAPGVEKIINIETIQNNASNYPININFSISLAQGTNELSVLSDGKNVDFYDKIKTFYENNKWLYTIDGYTSNIITSLVFGRTQVCQYAVNQIYNGVPYDVNMVGAETIERWIQIENEKAGIENQSGRIPETNNQVTPSLESLKYTGEER